MTTTEDQLRARLHSAGDALDVTPVPLDQLTGTARRRLRVRRVSVGLVAAAAATAGVVWMAQTVGDGGSESASCAGSVEWHGTEYLPYEVTKQLPQGEDLGRVRRLDCADRAGDEMVNPGPRYGQAVRIPGVDPAVAFAVVGESQVFSAVEPDQMPPKLEDMLAP